VARLGPSVANSDPSVARLGPSVANSDPSVTHSGLSVAHSGPTEAHSVPTEAWLFDSEPHSVRTEAHSATTEGTGTLSGSGPRCDVTKATSRDDDVVEQGNANDGCGLGDGARELNVLLARSRIAARVVVNEYERAGRLTQRNPNWIARGNVQAVNASRRDPSGGPKAVVAVKGE
jgi:hypothetical protein